MGRSQRPAGNGPGPNTGSAPGALAEFTQEDMLTVAVWHGELAQRGVPPRSNGIAVVICLGALLGGPVLAYAHMTWARACEERSLARADFHLRRAAQIMANFPDEADALPIAVIRRSFLERHGLPHEDEPQDEGFDDSPGSLPLREAQAYTLRDSGRLEEALALLDSTISLTAHLATTPGKCGSGSWMLSSTRISANMSWARLSTRSPRSWQTGWAITPGRSKRGTMRRRACSSKVSRVVESRRSCASAAGRCLGRPRPADRDSQQPRPCLCRGREPRL